MQIEVKKDVLLDQCVENIKKNHEKIIDDWCKAYLAELFQCGIDIKPGCFTLVQQQGLTLKNGELGYHYWFEPKDEKETINETMVKVLMNELNKIKDYVDDQVKNLSHDRYDDQFEGRLILNEIKKMLNFMECQHGN